MGKLTLSQGNTLLDQCGQLFTNFGFVKSSNEIKKIKNELNGQKDFQILNSTFKVLQTTFLVEYNTTHHRVLCSTFYKKRVNVVTKVNTTGLNNKQLDKRWAKMIEYRMKSRRVLWKLNMILKQGSQNEEEDSISMSYLYLASIDGVYGKNLKDILIFDMLANNNQINYNQIDRMNLSDIENYFNNVKNSDCLFDGWDEDIRNAVAHSSFWYDSKKQKIIYEERRKNRIKEKTKDEILEMLQKLTDIDLLVLLYNQIFRINKVIMDLK